MSRTKISLRGKFIKLRSQFRRPAKPGRKKSSALNATSNQSAIISSEGANGQVDRTAGSRRHQQQQQLVAAGHTTNATTPIRRGKRFVISRRFNSLLNNNSSSPCPDFKIYDDVVGVVGGDETATAAAAPSCCSANKSMISLIEPTDASLCDSVIGTPAASGPAAPPSLPPRRRSLSQLQQPEFCHCDLDNEDYLSPEGELTGGGRLSLAGAASKEDGEFMYSQL